MPDKKKKICSWISHAACLWLLSRAPVAGTAPADPFQEAMQTLRNGDYAEAFCLLRPLARDGDAEAQYNIGWFYANGQGLRVDMGKALEWWRLAAEQGHRDAEFALGFAYLADEKVKSNEREALKWLVRAARQGQEDAQEILRRMVSEQNELALARLRDLIGEPWLGVRRQIAGDKVNVRSGPGKNTRIIATLDRGTEVIEIGHRGRWLRVVLRDPLLTGWVFSDLLTE